MGRVTLRQGGRAVAGDLLNTMPVGLRVDWTGQDTSGAMVHVDPDSVTWGLSAPLGTIEPDAADPTRKALFTPNEGATGPIAFMATSHQEKLNDFDAEPAEGNLVNPPPPPAVQITGGVVEASQPVIGGGFTVQAARRR